MSSFAKYLILISVCLGMPFLQGCKQEAEFAENVGDINSGSDTDDGSGDQDDNMIPTPDSDRPTIINFFDDGDEDIAPGAGLYGKVYYLLNTSFSSELPATVKDRAGNNIEFPLGVTSVNQIIDRGYELPANILLTHLFIPTLSFQEGFQGPKGPIKDLLGKPLFEAFAIDVRGTVQLAEGMAAGNYEIAVLSDDGSILTADLGNTGSITDILVDNDGAHSTSLGCSSVALNFNDGQRLPIRLKYFQGPRDHIALSLLMRKLEPGELPGQDPLCGYTSNEDWFGDINDPNYEPDLVNLKYGELVTRGWFRPTGEMLRN